VLVHLPNMFEDIKPNDFRVQSARKSAPRKNIRSVLHVGLRFQKRLHYLIDDLRIDQGAVRSNANYRGRPIIDSRAIVSIEQISFTATKAMPTMFRAKLGN